MGDRAEQAEERMKELQGNLKERDDEINSLNKKIQQVENDLDTTTENLSTANTNFFVFDAVIGVSWNVLAYATGYRWLSRTVEDGAPSESRLDHYFGLVYDGAVEISAMYSMFVVAVFAS